MNNFEIFKNQRSIVIIGKFDPRIFHPSWFETNKLLSLDIISKLRINIIVPDISDLEGPEFQIIVSREKITIHAFKESFFETIKDFAENLLTLMPTISPKMLGVNSLYVFESNHKEYWHKVGDALSPKTYWEDLVENPGLGSISISSDRENPNAKNRTNITLKPIRLPKSILGIEININFHSEIDKESHINAIEKLSVNWNACNDCDTTRLISFLEKMVF